MKKYFLSIFLILFSLHTFAQQSNINLLSKKISPNFIAFENDDVHGIKNYNFKRKRFANNTIYAEIGGFGYYYTVNYEAMLQSMGRRMLNFRIGAGLISETNDKDTKANKISIPGLLYFSFGETNMLDIGIGITYRIYIENEIIPSGSLGFRHQKALGGFMYRIAITPTIETNESGYKIIQFWGGLSLGYAF